MNSTTIDIGTGTITFEQTNAGQSRFVALGIVIALMVVDIWIIASLVHFGIKSKKWRRLQPGNPDMLNSRLIYVSVIICSGVTFLNHFFVVVYTNIGFKENEDELCDSVNDLVKSFYALSFLSVIFFLWLRQRTLYTAFLPTAQFTKAIKCFSFAIFFITFFCGLTGLTLSLIPDDDVASSIGCVYEMAGNLRVPSLIVVGATVVFGQVSLLALFTHALLVMNKPTLKGKWKFLFCCQRHSTQQTNTTERPRDRTKFIVDHVIRKTTVFAALSLMSDLIVVSVSLLLSRESQRRDHVLILSAFAVTMNMFFVVFSFVAWRDMITSFCKSFSHHEIVTGSTEQTDDRII